MNKILLSIFIFTAFFAKASLVSAEDIESSASAAKEELTEDELSARMGRYGEVEEIPENFEFNPAEVRLWFDDHFDSVKQPVSMYYEFTKTGSYEEGFTDSVYLKVLKVNDDGTKDTKLDFFTAERKQFVNQDNVKNITGNPIIGIFMQGDVQEMNRITDGHWRHFQKQIKICLRENAKVEPITFTFDGKEYNGEKIYFSPYVNDPHRSDFERFADKYYEFIFSEELPGELYQIKTVIPDTAKADAKPLIEETLTLVNIKKSES